MRRLVAALAAGARRCGQAADNYPRQLARKLGLGLTDMTCSGATTAHLLGPWRELPAQLDALRADTALVTVTVGGNDVGYIGGLFAASCKVMPGAGVCGRASAPPPPEEADWQALAGRLDEIAREVRRRAPAARLVFVDYLTVLPEEGGCASAPMGAAEADAARAVAARLAAETAAATTRAQDMGMRADLLSAAALSAGHDACGARPWMTGFVAPAGARGFVPYHPRLAGMTAVADALAAMLGEMGEGE